MSNIYNITFDQGSSKVYTLTLQGDNHTNFDLTGYTARMQVRKTYGAATPVVDFNSTNGKIAVTDPTNGVLQISFAPADTASITFDNKDDETLDCVYDVHIDNGSGVSYVPVRGTFTLTRQVTR